MKDGQHGLASHRIVPHAPLAGLIESIGDWDMPPAGHRHERILPVPGTALIINAGYSCRDPEGHLWSFGSYDPWHA